VIQFAGERGDQLDSWSWLFAPIAVRRYQHG